VTAPSTTPAVTADDYYAIIPEWVLDTASARAVQVYGFLRRYADKGSLQSKPSRATLAKRARCSRNTIDRALNELVDIGALTVTPRFDDHGDRTSNLYHLHRMRIGGPTSGTTPLPADGTTPLPTNGAQNYSHSDPQSPEPHLATRNVAWDFYTHPDGFNLPAKTKAQQQRVGRLARELNAKIEHEDGMTDTLFERAAAWPAHFPDATLTPEAFEKHFTQLGQPPLRRTKRDVDQATERAKAQAMMNTPRPISDARRKAQARR